MNFLDKFLNRTEEEKQAHAEKVSKKWATYTKLIAMNENGEPVKSIRALEKESGYTLNEAYLFTK